MRNADELIEIRGARLRVRTAGDGPAILFVHGWALDLDMWAAQFANLADRYRLLAFDRRGFGFSSGEPAIEHDIADIEHLLDTLAVQRVTIVGMSQGARVALRWALRFRSRTDGLVLDGPPPDELPSTAISQSEVPIDAYRELMRSEGIDAVRQRWLQHPLMRLHSGDQSATTLVRESVSRYPGHDLAVGASQPSHSVDLHALDLPVLVINGEHDSAGRRAAGVELARVLPNARLAVIRAAGHVPSLDNPSAYNRALVDFLERKPAPSAGIQGSSSHRSACYAE